MSIFDDVNACVTTSADVAAADLLAANASSGAVGAAGLTTISPNGVGGYMVNDGLGHITQASQNNMGGVTFNDGHGHVDMWMADHVGGLYHP